MSRLNSLSGYGWLFIRAWRTPRRYAVSATSSTYRQCAGARLRKRSSRRVAVRAAHAVVVAGIGQPSARERCHLIQSQVGPLHRAEPAAVADPIVVSDGDARGGRQLQMFRSLQAAYELAHRAKVLGESNDNCSLRRQSMVSRVEALGRRCEAHEATLTAHEARRVRRARLYERACGHVRQHDRIG
eukprot:scaffold32404_cov77-Phaeocystis_antarctica.AAC.5